MARPPRGKRTTLSDGTRAVASKNPNGSGSVYFEPATNNSDGSTTPGRWRATWVDQNGKIRRVAAPTRQEAEERRDAKAEAVGKRIRPASRFDASSTVNDLLDWWLTSIAKHRVKTSTYDSYARFASYLADGIGAQPIIDVGTEMLTQWQADLLEQYAPYTVLNCRKVCRQAFREAVKLELIATNPFDLVDAPRARAASSARALPIDDAKALIVAAGDFRLGAAVTLLFCQGWRVSEVLGLAWEDLDLDAGTAQIRRGSAYTPSLGTVLGTTKTSGAEGIHYLAPTSIDRLRQWKKQQRIERDAADEPWPDHHYAGEVIHPVFTKPDGGLANRQSVVKAIRRAAKKAGIDPKGVASHTGRRTVITALYANGGVDLADIARHVGHSDSTTTAGYVRSLGHRPSDTARRAAELLDPAADGSPDAEGDGPGPHE